MQVDTKFDRGTSLEVIMSPGRAPSPALRCRLTRASSAPEPRHETIDAKLNNAASRRQEAIMARRAWLRARSERHQALLTKQDAERKRSRAKLQGRLERASRLRGSILQGRRDLAFRFATWSPRSHSRAERRTQKQQKRMARGLSEHQDAAVQRHEELLAARRWRLRLDREMRIAQIEEATNRLNESRELLRLLLEERQAGAIQVRRIRLDLRAARAGAHAAVAHVQGILASSAKEQRAETIRTNLDKRMKLAEERRKIALQNRMAHTSNISPRPSNSGSI